MRYFAPRFRPATLAGNQNKLLSKLGGVPWGLPIGCWPFCCGQPEKLLAQLCHEPPMLNLGDPDAVLHLFQCLECGGIDDGGRDAFLIDRSQLGQALVRIEGYDHCPELGNRLIGEFWIDGWDKEDDGIPAARLPEFFDENELWSLQADFPNIDWFDSRQSTRFGGSPRWTGNGPMNFPPAPFEFLLQFDNYLYLPGPLPCPNDVGCGVSIQSQSSAYTQAMPEPGMERINAPWTIIQERSVNYYYAEFTNLGSDGTAYVFIDRTQQPHKVKWFWNR